MEVLASPVTELVKCLIIPVVHQIQYIIQYKKNIDKLRDQLEVLGRSRNDVNRSIDAARRRGESIKDGVQAWIERVDLFHLEAMRFLDDGILEEGSKSCLVGCPSRYRISKEAKRMLNVVNELRLEGDFDVVSEIMPPPSIEIMPTGDFEVFDVTKVAMENVMEALRDREINLIGVYGMGGVGKTMLVKEVGKKAIKGGLFDQVVMATVSQNVNVKRIQGEIAESLGLRLEEESEFPRARRLLGRLKQEKRVLVVLDDLWARVELSDVGIPSADDHNGCKVVITTRSLDVCSVMETQVKVEVEVLSEKDSWFLFRKKAGHIVDTSTLFRVSREVAEECKGLPIAIVTLARALRGKDLNVWIDAALQLRKSISTDIEGMSATVVSSIKLSYDYLASDETKFCFLLCCLFPEDYGISFEVLMWYMVGEGLFGYVETLEEARRRVRVICDKLKASSLLLKGKYDEEVVMHDVVRDVAISIASKEANGFLPKSGIELKQWPEREKLDDYIRISLMNNGINELSSQPFCPKILVLLLQQNKPLKGICNSFFEGMKNLTVLDLSNTSISVIPQSFLCLTQLQTLLLESCYRLNDVSLIGKSKNLKILSLKNSSVQMLPEEIGGLTKLRLLNLSGNRHLKLICPRVISNLSSLEELYMSNSFSGWEAEDGKGINASLCEVASLTRLTALYLHVKNVECLSINIPDNNWENLQRFCISFGDWYWYSKAVRSMCLNNSSFVSNWVKVLLDKTDKLTLRFCHHLKNVAQLNAGRFNNLNSMRIWDCDHINYIASGVEDIQEKAFARLQKLHLNSLKNLEKLCYGPLPNGLFDNLVILKVRKCDKLITILSSSLLLSLQNLEGLLAAACYGLKDVFDYEGPEDGRGVLPKLKVLRLSNLPGLAAMWKGIVPVSCLESLKQVEVENCDCLRYLFSPSMVQKLQELKKIEIVRCGEMVALFSEDENEQPTTSVSRNESVGIELFNSSRYSSLTPPMFLQKLTELKLHYCENLMQPLPMRIALGLPNLQILDICHCYRVEVLIDEDFKDMDNMPFTSLRTLKLEGLPKLSSLYQGPRVILWPSLEEFQVGDCPNLETLPFSPQIAPKLRVIEGSEDWLSGLEWNEESIKLQLQLLFQNRERMWRKKLEEVSHEANVEEETERRIVHFTLDD